MDPSQHPTDYSVEEIVTVHYVDSKRSAVTFFNGHIEIFGLDQPMSRKEYNEFHKTNVISNKTANAKTL
jgi:hypothetical protein